MKSHRRRKRILILVLLSLLLLSPPARLWQSMAVMGVFSHLHETKGLPAREGFRLQIPGGLATPARDWYPLVMTFCPGEGFGQFVGRPGAELTILYNFPAFSPAKGCSDLFNPSSPYYNSFYGAYVVQCPEGPPFGFLETKEGDLTVDTAAMAKAPQYDFQRLVLRDFGLQTVDAVFDWTLTGVQDSVPYVGWENWTRLDASLTVNGAAHNPAGFAQSYLQYGYPAWKTENPLAPVEMTGRLYLRYFAEWNVSVCFYLLARDPAVLESCDRDLVSQSVLTPET